MPISFIQNLEQYNLEKKDKLGIFQNKDNKLFPNNILFKQQNYVSEMREGDYDTIICLSTSKWIHLNYGDVGIKLLFHNIYKQLKLDGMFIFEFQNWKSYKKRKDLNNRIKENFKNIRLKPESFKEYLESTYGFECIEITNPPSNSKKMYTRPIYIFKKIK